MKDIKKFLGLIAPYSIYTQEELYELLKKNNYFVAPASTKYHGSYKGGLVAHSLNVMSILVHLTNRNDIQWQREVSPIIIGLFHDLCKCDSYESQGNGYVRQQDQLLEGHGEKSVIIASTLVQLTIEEAMCIRYHMGAYVDKSERKALGLAIKEFPNILWVHHADMLATYCKER